MHTVVVVARTLEPRSLLVAVALLALPIAACGASAPTAVLGAKAPEAVAPSGTVEAYALTGELARVEVDVSAGKAYTIHFPNVTGTMAFSPDNPEASSLEIKIDTTDARASWQTAADIARDKFLHAGSYPEAFFSSSAIRKSADPEGGYTLFGTLVLHGVSQTLSTPAKLQVEPCKLTIDVEFSIDRQKFGVVNDGGLDPFVSDTVVVRVAAAAPRSGEACAPKLVAKNEP
ncbi:MAG: YceI family protein [Polyangiaceae bacterium]|nr:YceI family protein [Polyangiaceae bacterium]